MEFVNGKDDIPYTMENNPNVWNHQPVHIPIDQIDPWWQWYSDDIPTISPYQPNNLLMSTPD